MNVCADAFNNYNFLGVDKPGDAPKRGRKAKLKLKGGGSESMRKQKDTEAGLPLLSGQTESKATCSHTSKVSESETCPTLKSSDPDVTQSHAVKSLQGLSRTSPSWRSEMDKTSSKGSEEGTRGSTLVQSRLAWKTMASPAPTIDALKVSNTITN